MTHAFVIARRDLAERTPVFVAAIVLAIVPFVISIIPGMPSFNRTDVLATSGGLVSIGFTLGLALVLGVTMIGRDLSDRRMSFYFSKPVSASAIWCGKVIAAIVTLALCFAVVFMPSYLAGTTSWEKSWNVDLPTAFAAIGLAALTLLLLGHAFSTMSRSKSPLIAFDAIFAALTILVGVLVVRQLAGGFAVELMKEIGYVSFAALLLILLAGGAWQLAKGRADRRRNHIELSRFVWIGIAIVLAALGGFTAWVVHVAPSDLVAAFVTDSPNGSWVMLSGPTRHRGDYHASFAYDLQSGRSFRIDSRWSEWWLSHDGRTLGFFRFSALNTAIGELNLLPLDGSSGPIATQIWMRSRDHFALSDDDKRIVIMGDDAVSVYDIATNRSLVSAHTAERGTMRAFFVTRDLVRIYVESWPRAVAIYELNVPSRSLVQTGRYKTEAKHGSMIVSADGTRALVNEADERGKGTSSVIDARTGALIVTVPAAGLGKTTFLADNSVVTLSDDDAHRAMLGVYGPDGALRKTMPLGIMISSFIGGELSGGRLVVIGSDRRSPGQKNVHYTTDVVDYMNGTVLRTTEGLRPAMGAWWPWFAGDPRRLVEDARRPLAAYAGKTLCAWQPLTGEKKELLRF